MGLLPIYREPLSASRTKRQPQPASSNLFKSTNELLDNEHDLQTETRQINNSAYQSVHQPFGRTINYTSCPFCRFLHNILMIFKLIVTVRINWKPTHVSQKKFINTICYVRKKT